MNDFLFEFLNDICYENDVELATVFATACTIIDQGLNPLSQKSESWEQSSLSAIMEDSYLEFCESETTEMALAESPVSEYYYEAEFEGLDGSLLTDSAMQTAMTLNLFYRKAKFNAEKGYFYQSPDYPLIITPFELVGLLVGGVVRAETVNYLLYLISQSKTPIRTILSLAIPD